jgi:hypothetical protein
MRQVNPLGRAARSLAEGMRLSLRRHPHPHRTCRDDADGPAGMLRGRNGVSSSSAMLGMTSVPRSPSARACFDQPARARPPPARSSRMTSAPAARPRLDAQLAERRISRLRDTCRSYCTCSAPRKVKPIRARVPLRACLDPTSFNTLTYSKGTHHEENRSLSPVGLCPVASAYDSDATLSQNPQDCPAGTEASVNYKMAGRATSFATAGRARLLRATKTSALRAAKSGPRFVRAPGVFLQSRDSIALYHCANLQGARDGRQRGKARSP